MYEDELCIEADDAETVALIEAALLDGFIDCQNCSVRMDCGDLKCELCGWSNPVPRSGYL